VTIPGQDPPQTTGRGGRGGAGGGRGGAGGGRGGAGGGRGGQQAPAAYLTFGGTIPADVGEYVVVVTAGGKTFTKKVQVIEDAWFDRMF
jgi:hypothetical protein